MKGIVLSVIGILLNVTIVIFPQSDIPVVLFVLFVLYFFLYRFLIYGFYWFGYVVPVLAVMVAFFPENLLWVFIFSLYVFVTKMALICYKSREIPGGKFREIPGTVY